MTEQLHRRLADLAGEAATTAPLDPAGLWRTGKRRQRRRMAACAAVAAAVVMGIVGVGVVLPSRQVPAPVTPPPSKLHLPDHLYSPSPWSKGTAELGEIGPLAAIRSAQRYEPEGWAGKRVEPAALAGVSAVDGTTRFLDLGLDDRYRQPWDGPSTALSPDGTKLGFVLEREKPGVPNGVVQEGWAVYDTVTGRLRELRDPKASAVATDGSDLMFTGDSKYLVTSYSPAEYAQEWRRHSLVVWDVATGRRSVAEGPGEYWSPNVGYAPDGVLWARKFGVFGFDPATGQRTRFHLPKAVVNASIGPGAQGFAYIGGDWTPGPDGGISGDTWRLYVGTAHAHGLPRGAAPYDLREVDVRTDELGYVVGWRDATHVVVSGWHAGVVTVDVTTGEVARSRMIDGNGMAAVAGDLVANPSVPGVRPPAAHDPRRLAHLTAYVGVPLAVVGILLWRRREQR